MPSKRSSEFRAYPWILKKLKLRDWNTANPNRNPKGEVWTQQECLDHPELGKALGQQRPENVAIITAQTFWIIEAKQGRTNISQAVKEAQDYANDINNSSTVIKAAFTTGVAGSDEDGYEIRNYYRLDGNWKTVTVGKLPLTRFLSKKDALRILETNSPNLIRPELSVTEVVQLSRDINAILHIAKVGKEQRALVVAILLLALHEDLSIKYAGDPRVFISDINTRAEAVFRQANKNDLWEGIKLRTSNDTIEGVANAISTIISILKETDILHAAQGTDLLGSFFENFLRYGNTSKELGIVLTPRHICWLAAETLEIGITDIIYDPAAGSGGFLIAAFNRIQNMVAPKQAANFAKLNLYGAEDTDRVAALAFINMYFRGDGKHNLKLDSCFNWKLIAPSKKASKPIFRIAGQEKKSETLVTTKVMMNPPFSLKDSAQKEIDFIDHGLRQLTQNGILFSVLPASILYEKQYEDWRNLLIANHSIMAVVAFPIDLFYPVSTETVGIFIRKGTSHDSDDDVLWVRLLNDGFMKRKGYRVERKEDGYKRTLMPFVDRLKAWVIHRTKLDIIPGECEFHPIKSTELLPQSHLGTPVLEQHIFDQEVRTIYRHIMVQHWEQKLNNESYKND